MLTSLKEQDSLRAFLIIPFASKNAQQQMVRKLSALQPYSSKQSMQQDAQEQHINHQAGWVFANQI